MLVALLGTFLISPYDGATLLGGVIGTALDPIILIPSAIIGSVFFQKETKAKIISLAVIILIVLISSFLISKNGNQYSEIALIRVISAAFICCIFSYIAKLFQRGEEESG